MMLLKKYLYPILAVVCLSLVISAFFYGRSSGYDSCLADAQKAVDEYKEREVKDIKKVEKAKQATEDKYNERVKIIYRAQDPTECLDKPLGDIGLGGLLPPEAGN